MQPEGYCNIGAEVKGMGGRDVPAPGEQWSKGHMVISLSAVPFGVLMKRLRRPLVFGVPKHGPFISELTTSMSDGMTG